MRRTPSMSSLHEVMFAPSNITHASNSFSFLLTGEGTFLYGVCVVRDVSALKLGSRTPPLHTPTEASLVRDVRGLKQKTYVNIARVYTSLAYMAEVKYVSD